MAETDLFYPQYLEASLGGEQAINLLEARVAEVATEESEADGAPVSVLVRTRNDAENIENIWGEILLQRHSGDVELVVVDTESNDGTAEIARRNGATVVSIAQADFTYPKALNMGFEAASYNTVFMTVGHANLSNPFLLRAATRHIASDIAGGAGSALVNANASRTERLTYTLSVLSQLRSLQYSKKAGMGALQATGAVVAREAWRELGGFDERFAAGGEDADMARRIIEAGYKIVRDPALSTHHTHGLGPIDSARQMLHWQSVFKGPAEFDEASVLRRRPDLASKFSDS